MSRRDTAGVLVRPPLLCLGAIVSGAGLHLLLPVPVLASDLEPLGASLVLLAVLLFAWARIEFARAGTPVRTTRPTRTLVRTGPYRFTRNPIYLSFLVLHLGIGIWTKSLCILATLLPTIVLLSKGVVEREERYLAARLGEEYRRYTGTVRRWI